MFSNYQEHHWDLKRIVAEYPDSRINIEKPESSEGLTQEKARELFEVRVFVIWSI
jgi:hypothetical protein